VTERDAGAGSREWQPRVPVVAMLEARRPDELASLLRHRGLQPYHAPALREEPQPDPAAVDAFITRLAGGQIDVVILLTGVGTTAILETARSLDRLAELVEALPRVTVLARGPKPVAALRPYGLRPACVAAAPYTTAEVLAALAEYDLAGRVVVVQLAGEPNPELHQALAARGAQVEELAPYRWTLPLDQAPLERFLVDVGTGRIDAVVVTSAAQVQNLFTVAARHGGVEALRRHLRATIVASVGPVCTRALQAHGVQVDVEASPPKMGPLVAALATALAARRRQAAGDRRQNDRAADAWEGR
jgi:uroporphyrinogen-III synthase